MTNQDIKSMATSSLVALYNRLTGKSIKKFSSRAAGEKQVAAAQQSNSIKSLDLSQAPPALAKPKLKRKRATGLTLSAAVKDSWANSKVRAARAERAHVKVDDTEHRSVAAAFEALKLPMGKHIKFRMALKASASGRLAYEHDGKSIMFSLVKEKK